MALEVAGAPLPATVTATIPALNLCWEGLGVLAPLSVPQCASFVSDATWAHFGVPIAPGLVQASFVNHC